MSTKTKKRHVCPKPLNCFNLKYVKVYNKKYKFNGVDFEVDLSSMCTEGDRERSRDYPTQVKESYLLTLLEGQLF